MRPYSFEFQTDIVQCCFQSYEDQFYDDDGNSEELVLDDDELPDKIPELDYNALKAWRNGIADAMRAHYQLAGEG